MPSAISVKRRSIKSSIVFANEAVLTVQFLSLWHIYKPKRYESKTKRRKLEVQQI